MFVGSISPTLIIIPEFPYGRLQPTILHTWTGREECMLWVPVSSFWHLFSIFIRVPMSWTHSMSGQELEKNTTSSPRKFSDSQISGKILPRRLLLPLLLLVVIPLSSYLHGNMFSVVPGLHRNSLIPTPISHLSAVSWLSVQPHGSLFHLKTPEELTTLIRLGQLSSEETTLLPLKLSAESHSKKAQLISLRVDSL